jgi:dTMP kinase
MFRFITFEGGDGVGKSTQIAVLESYLTARGYICVTTREPGGTSLGESIRRTLLESGTGPLDPSTELFLYLADRAHHIKEVVIPALAQGRVVLCDRHTDSTLAYQGYGRGIDLRMLRSFNEFATGGVRPDLTFLLDCPVQVGLSRISKRQSRSEAIGGPDRFEREARDFHQRVHQGFLKIAVDEPDRICVIDAARSEKDVFQSVKQIIEQKMSG